MAPSIAGHATAEGTARYAARLGDRVAPGHFRAFDGLHVSSVGLGTYLGREDAATDALYLRAIARAFERAVNVVDTAVNYRHQRSERAIGRALAAAIERGDVRRDEVVVSTKGGYVPFDGGVPDDPRRWFTETYLRPGIVRPDDVVGGAHCMTPRYLADQIERSRANLGLETLDVYYLHNPETQLDAVTPAEFHRRLRDAFGALERAADEGKIRRYGTATWNGYRCDPGERGALSLVDVVALAREVGGPHHRFRVVQLPYNLGMHEAFTRATQKVEAGFAPVLEAAQRLGVYVMTSVPMFQGRLARDLPAEVAELLPGLHSDAQRAIQFARSTPGVGTALCGMKSVDHVDENLGVAVVEPMAWERFRRLFSEA
jgi:aryl-alcohol dehydrogenase-like predicted oxidoreductase